MASLGEKLDRVEAVARALDVWGLRRAVAAVEKLQGSDVWMAAVFRGMNRHLKMFAGEAPRTADEFDRMLAEARGTEDESAITSDDVKREMECVIDELREWLTRIEGNERERRKIEWLWMQCKALAI